MSNKIKVPNQNIHQFYEGSDTNLYTRLTGSNLNKAPNALSENINFLELVVNGLAGFANEWDPSETYSRSYPVRFGSLTYLSLTDKNKGNSPKDSPSNWVMLENNINDLIISKGTVWSSERTQAEILSMAIALG